VLNYGLDYYVELLGLDCWAGAGPLDWTIGLDYWAGPLDWTAGLVHWTGLLGWGWSIGLD
jgi:hypothetical protein